MCGLVGIAGKLAYKDEATLKRLLLLDYFRGPDATGLAAIRSNGECKMMKLPSHPLDLFDSRRFNDALNGTQSTVFIGHNRAATRGLKTASNAHPFQFEHIVGAHNGTLTTASHRALEAIVGEKFDVDSQAIFAAIAEVGIEEAIKVMETGNTHNEGAWSLVWYDQKQNTLNFLRNEHRPMWYAYNEELDRVFWASEWPMIDAAVRLSNTAYNFWHDKEGHRFFSTEKDILYSYDVDELKAGSKTRPKPMAKPMKGKEPEKAAPSRTTYDPFNRRTTTTSTTTLPGLPGPLGRKDKDVKVVTLLGDPSDPFGGVITKEKFEELAKYGCSWCSDAIKWGDQGVVIFERDDIMLCGNCSCSDPNANRIHVKNLDSFL